MPYTLSHAAAVLPFARPLARLRILSATVIGSMVPDFGYFFPRYPPRLFTHSAWSLLTFSLPWGLLCYWVFQRVMKTPLFSLLPDQAYMRWRAFAAPAAMKSITQWLLAACGLLFGAVTHLAWDGFTHEGARGMRMVPEIDDWMFELHGHHMVGARLAQDGSSLLGLLLVLVMLIYALRRGGTQTLVARELSATHRRNWVLAYATAVVMFSVGFDVLGHLGKVYGFSPGGLVHGGAVALLRGLALASLGVGLCLRRYLRA